jgi:uncharacterized protein UPF0014/polysaccharide deacetylase
MLSQQVLTPALIVVCVVMVLAAALIYWLTALGSPWTVPWAAIRAVVQLAAIAGVLAAALARLWSSILVLVVMFIVASVTAAQRSQASRGSPLLTAPLALGMLAVLPLLLLSGVVPLTGVAVVPIVAIVLGNTMTADQIQRNADFLRNTYGTDGTPFFRPPYGLHTAATDRVAADLGYPTITLWSGTIGDSLPESEANLVAAATRSFAPQQIVLAHANLPTITHCYNQLSQLIAGRNLQTVTLNDVFS